MDNRSLFEGNQVILTALIPEKDASVLSAWTKKPEFTGNHFEGFFRPLMVSEIKKKYKEDLKKAEESKQGYYFAIREKESENFIGILRFTWMWHSHQTARMIIDIGEEKISSQVFEEALCMGLRYAFMELSLHRVFVILSSYFEQEITRYEKAGFLRESQRREGTYFDGKYYDLLLYAILKPEWKEKHKELSQ